MDRGPWRTMRRSTVAPRTKKSTARSVTPHNLESRISSHVRAQAGNPSARPPAPFDVLREEASAQRTAHSAHTSRSQRRSPKSIPSRRLAVSPSHRLTVSPSHRLPHPRFYPGTAQQGRRRRRARDRREAAGPRSLLRVQASKSTPSAHRRPLRQLPQVLVLTSSIANHRLSDAPISISTPTPTPLTNHRLWTGRHPESMAHRF